jgi:hypothetical protein
MLFFSIFQGSTPTLTRFIRHNLLKSAAKTIQNPKGNSHDFAIHAMVQPLSDAIESSMPKGMIEHAMRKVPAQTIAKKAGCEARMTRWSLYL